MQSPQDLAAALTANDKDDDTLLPGTKVYPTRQIDGIKGHYGFLAAYKATGIITAVGPNMVKVRWDAWSMEMDMRPDEIVAIAEHLRNQVKDRPAAADKENPAVDYATTIDEQKKEIARLQAKIAELTAPANDSMVALPYRVKRVPLQNGDVSEKALQDRLNEYANQHYTLYQIVSTESDAFVVWRLITTGQEPVQHDSEQTIFTDGERQRSAAAQAYRDEVDAALNQAFNTGLTTIHPHILRPRLEKPQ